MTLPIPDLRLVARRLENYFFPLVFLILAAALLSLRRIPNWARAIRGAGWPAVEGRVETVAVNGFAEQSLAEIGYSYLVDGARYSGYFSRQFADQQDAWTYLNPLKGRVLIVRYKPSAPGTSAFRLTEQSAIFKARAGNFPRTLFRVFRENMRS